MQFVGLEALAAATAATASPTNARHKSGRPSSGSTEKRKQKEEKRYSSTSSAEEVNTKPQRGTSGADKEWSKGSKADKKRWKGRGGAAFSSAMLTTPMSSRNGGHTGSTSVGSGTFVSSPTYQSFQRMPPGMGHNMPYQRAIAPHGTMGKSPSTNMASAGLASLSIATSISTAASNVTATGRSVSLPSPSTISSSGVPSSTQSEYQPDYGEYSRPGGGGGPPRSGAMFEGMPGMSTPQFGGAGTFPSAMSYYAMGRELYPQLTPQHHAQQIAPQSIHGPVGHNVQPPLRTQAIPMPPLSPSVRTTTHMPTISVAQPPNAKFVGPAPTSREAYKKKSKSGRPAKVPSSSKKGFSPGQTAKKKGKVDKVSKKTYKGNSKRPESKRAVGSRGAGRGSSQAKSNSKANRPSSRQSTFAPAPGAASSLPNAKSSFSEKRSLVATPPSEIGTSASSLGKKSPPPGTEQTGRWTRDEHKLFLKGLQRYGKEWKKVAGMVKTRTVVQTRTHAQKYFQKVAKAQSGDAEGDGDGQPPGGPMELGLSVVESSEVLRDAVNLIKKRKGAPSERQSSALWRQGGEYGHLVQGPFLVGPQDKKGGTETIEVFFNEGPSLPSSVKPRGRDAAFKEKTEKLNKKAGKGVATKSVKESSGKSSSKDKGKENVAQEKHKTQSLSPGKTGQRYAHIPERKKEQDEKGGMKTETDTHYPELSTISSQSTFGSALSGLDSLAMAAGEKLLEEGHLPKRQRLETDSHSSVTYQEQYAYLHPPPHGESLAMEPGSAAGPHRRISDQEHANKSGDVSNQMHQPSFTSHPEYYPSAASSTYSTGHKEIARCDHGQRRQPEWKVDPEGYGSNDMNKLSVKQRPPKPSALTIINPERLPIHRARGSSDSLDPPGGAPGTPWDHQVESLLSSPPPREGRTENYLRNATFKATYRPSEPSKAGWPLRSLSEGRFGEVYRQICRRDPVSVVTALNDAQEEVIKEEWERQQRLGQTKAARKAPNEGRERALEGGSSSAAPLEEDKVKVESSHGLSLLRHGSDLLPSVPVLRLLSEHQRDRRGFSLAMAACALRIPPEKRSMDIPGRILRHLLAYGASLSGRDWDGMNCLHYAAAAGNEGVLRFLLDRRGADRDARNRWGDSPLHLAARLGHIGCIRLLVKRGADVCLQNTDHLTALDVAGVLEGGPARTRLGRRTPYWLQKLAYDDSDETDMDGDDSDEQMDKEKEVEKDYVAKSTTAELPYGRKELASKDYTAGIDGKSPNKKGGNGFNSATKVSGRGNTDQSVAHTKVEQASEPNQGETGSAIGSTGEEKPRMPTNGGKKSSSADSSKPLVYVATTSRVPPKSAAHRRRRLRSLPLVDQDRRAQVRRYLLQVAPQLRTAILHHGECQEHLPRRDVDWEAPGRVEVVLRRLKEKQTIPQGELEFCSDFPRASVEILARAHSKEYIKAVNDLSKQVNANKDQSSIAFTPHIQRRIHRHDIAEIKADDVCDTSFSPGSLRAARRAVGAVCCAIDRVASGVNRNAFCLIRPPGHHAGRDGLLADASSCGFCIFNNVAAGALYAIATRGLRRVAIVDIDVHHGNGTEEIVRAFANSQPKGQLLERGRDLEKPLRESTSQRDTSSVSTNSSRSEQADPSSTAGYATIDREDASPLSSTASPSSSSSPGSASASPASTSSSSSSPPSLSCTPSSIFRHGRSFPEQSPSQLFFFSIHLFDRDEAHNYEFYPGTGDDDDLERNIVNVPMSPFWKAEQAAMGTRSGGRRNGDGKPRPSGREDYKLQLARRLLPALRAFNPELILLSAGFDAAKGDVGNARHDVPGNQGIDLEPEDYAWITERIQDIARVCCDGKLVSVLEGGYGIQLRSSKVKPGTLDRHSLADNVVEHIRSIADPVRLRVDALSSRFIDDKLGGVENVKRRSSYMGIGRDD